MPVAPPVAKLFGESRQCAEKATRKAEAIIIAAVFSQYKKPAFFGSPPDCFAPAGEEEAVFEAGESAAAGFTSEGAEIGGLPLSSVTVSCSVGKFFICIVCSVG